MEKKSSFAAPIIVLVAICFVASAVLAGVFKITDPLIQTRAQEAANKAMTEVLPEGREFTAFSGETVDGITAAYSTGNGAGTVSSTSFNGFGGAVKLMVGVDKEGKVTGIQVMEQSETPGVGSNALTPEYLARFTGADSVDGIDAYSGATFTSKAVRRGVEAALKQAAAISGGGNAGPSQDALISEAVFKLIPGIKEYFIIATSADGQTVVYSDGNATGSHTGYAIQAQAKGHDGDVKVIVGLDKDGKITGVIPVASSETIGADALKNEAFLNQFVGETAIGEAGSKTIDGVSGATFTSNAVVECVKNALAMFATLSK